MTLAEILQKCKSILENHYRSRFRGLVLFGSAARGEAGPESDIDLLVLLDRPDDYFGELRTIVDLLYPVQLESDRLISAKPAPADDFDQGRTPLYRIAQREGVRW
jgi:predicted nucleotidyltransferase